jgi:Leucine-rich repeat (LRR) protein
MHEMEYLSLRQTSITTLEPIRAMTQLIFLDLVGSPIDDAGLKPVNNFVMLNQLWLGGTRVTDAGLEHLVGLQNLILLDLDRTGISDDGLGVLCNLPELNHLNLHDTRVTDAGLAGKLGRLACRDLVVSGPRVTPAKLDVLRMTFPNVRIMGADLPVPKAGSSPLR